MWPFKKKQFVAVLMKDGSRKVFLVKTTLNGYRYTLYLNKYYFETDCIKKWIDL